MFFSPKKEIELIENKNIMLDNEYTIMSEIAENEKITQRELSKTLGVSVSTVNVLITKMIREGLIKMTQVSQKQVLYMLTPAGMMEKAKKTVSYLKIHYRAIYETKEKIKIILNELAQRYDVIFVLMSDSELSQIIEITIDEYKIVNKNSNIIIIPNNNIPVIENTKQPVLIHMAVNIESLKYYIENFEGEIINLAEKL